MAQIALEHVYKRYEDGSEAVKDFNLCVSDKEFVVFVGPSGCGKSTTLRMIAGLEGITDGVFLMDGKRMNEVEACDRDIAMVFQNYALYPHMTVYDNIAYSLKLRKLSKDNIRHKVEEVADILDIRPILQRKPRELSGGQKQRVAMGRAIVREPRVFLMDEPLSNLDAKLRTQMRGEILKLYRSLSTTFIYVTHDQTEAMTLGTRIVVMKDGVIQQIDSPGRLYDSPANKFVAGFIGTPQMNFIEAVCTESGKDVIAKAGQAEGKLPHVRGQWLRENGYIGRKIVLGIRPEDIYDRPEDFVSRNCMKTRQSVRVYEMLGAEAYLYFDFAGSSMAARVEPDTAARRDHMVTWGLDMDKAHIFDPVTELALGV